MPYELTDPLDVLLGDIYSVYLSEEYECSCIYFALEDIGLTLLDYFLVLFYRPFVES